MTQEQLTLIAELIDTKIALHSHEGGLIESVRASKIQEKLEDTISEIDDKNSFRAIGTTAAQRAEAMMRALDLWVEEVNP